MLSRIAESLYWIGRYTERAEMTARVLDVAQRAVLEGSDLGSSASLASVMGGVEVSGSRDDVLAAYGVDRYVPESVASSVRAARENARTIREALPNEMWEAINGWHLQLTASGPSDLTGGGAHAFLTAMKARSYQLTGVSDGSMPRTESWDWLQVGRHLERLVFGFRVLAVRTPTLTGSGFAEAYGYTVLLRCFSAVEAFRATYRAGVGAHRVTEFLLLDDAFPRSALYAVRRLDEATARVTDETYGDAARRIVGRLRAQLEYREIDEILAEGTSTFTTRLAGQCFDVHTALVEEPFARGASLAMRPDRAGASLAMRPDSAGASLAMRPQNTGASA
ncbi:MAG TPA: alpha-E domain-containing protein [Mycobacteriales bacterium]